MATDGACAETVAHLDGSEISSFLNRMEKLKGPAARAEAASRDSSEERLFMTSRKASQDPATRRAGRSSGDQALMDILKELQRLALPPGRR